MSQPSTMGVGREGVMKDHLYIKDSHTVWTEIKNIDCSTLYAFKWRKFVHFYLELPTSDIVSTVAFNKGTAIFSNIINKTTVTEFTKVKEHKVDEFEYRNRDLRFGDDVRVLVVLHF